VYRKSVKATGRNKQSFPSVYISFRFYCVIKANTRFWWTYVV